MDTTSQAGRMFFYTLTNYAEWERSVIRDRMHAGRLRRAQEGKDPGISLPFGYTKDAASGAFVAVPHEAAIVRRIFALYRQGAGLLAIADQLNREATPFRGGRRWQVNTLSYLLANRAYTGDLVWGLRARNPRSGKRPGEKAVLRREEPLVVRAGVYPTLVSQAEFAEVQRIKAERPTVGRGGGRSVASEYLLTGFLRCGHCGRPMVGQHNDPRRAGGYYYCCITRRDQGASACPARSIPCHLLDGQVEAQVVQLYEAERARRGCMDSLASEAAQQGADLKARLAEADRHLVRLRERDRKLCREYAAEVLTLAEFRDLRAAVQEEITRLAGARADLAARLGALEEARCHQEHLEAQAASLHLWSDLTVVQRKHVLRQLVQQVRAYKGEEDLTCEVTWKVPAASSANPPA